MTPSSATPTLLRLYVPPETPVMSSWPTLSPVAAFKATMRWVIDRVATSRWLVTLFRAMLRVMSLFLIKACAASSALTFQMGAAVLSTSAKAALVKSNSMDNSTNAFFMPLLH